jgi:hypothetical protein
MTRRTLESLPPEIRGLVLQKRGLLKLSNGFPAMVLLANLIGPIWGHLATTQRNRQSR